MEGMNNSEGTLDWSSNYNHNFLNEDEKLRKDVTNIDKELNSYSTSGSLALVIVADEIDASNESQLILYNYNNSESSPNLITIE